MAGGVGLAKTKEKRTGSTVTKEIPTCLHLGVQVNIDGFVSEIILLSHQVDQSSNSFNRAMSDAQNIVSQLSVLANTPVPESFLKVEEEPSVVAMDSIIKETEKELQIAIEDRPTYILPDIYRTEEQKNLTDEQYLEYLSNTDGERVREISIIKEKIKLIPFWFFIILGIVCFFVAAIISPTADNNNQETINQELSNTN